jgi:hypothetical protein
LKALDHFAEVRPPQGSMGARGIKNLLGRPAELSQIDILVRETVQNVWDARIDGRSPSCRFDVRNIDRSRFELLLGTSMERPELAKLPECVRLIEISDFDTHGLSGPTRADTETAAGAETNYVDFILNFGEPPSHAHGGGTYGYGRSILYRMSAVKMIGVYSRVSTGTSFENRFVIVSFWDKSGNETGRHWWGVIEEEPRRPSPLTGEAADVAAELLGFTLRTGSETGTSIALIEPSVESDEDGENPSHLLTEDELRTQIICAVYRHCWPKLVPRPDSHMPEMLVTVGALKLGDPRKIPTLFPFVESYLAVTGQSNRLNVEPILGPHNAFRAGSLSVCTVVPTTLGKPELPDKVLTYFAQSNILNMVALMRAPNLVVRYFGDRQTIDGSAWGGVFKVVDDSLIEIAFANSEPPAHDDWAPNFIEESSQRSLVKVTLEKIGRVVREKSEPSSSTSAPHSGSSLGGLSQSLAQFLPFDWSQETLGRRSPRGGTVSSERGSEPGDGIPPQPGESTGTHGGVSEGGVSGTGVSGSLAGLSGDGLGGVHRNNVGPSNKGPSSPAVVIVSSTYDEVDGKLQAVVTIRVSGPAQKRWRLWANPVVIVDGSQTESTAPENDSTPDVAKWKAGGIEYVAESIEGWGTTEASVWIALPPNAMVEPRPVALYLNGGES